MAVQQVQNGICLIAVILASYLGSSIGQSSPPCTRMDGSTSKDLRVRISEATQQEIDDNPLAYRSLLGINGVVYNSNINHVSVELIQNNALINPSEYFLIEDNFDGINIRLIKGLDRDGISTAASDDFQDVKYTLKCTDSSNTKFSYSLTIALTDVNDNAPVFQKLAYSFSVAENSPLGTFVGIVSASDKDEAGSPNSQLVYSLTGSTQSFTIDAQSGAIFTAAVLDRETIEKYSLVVMVTDLGIQRLSSNTSVIINILDVDDNAPVFTQSSYTATIVEDAVINSVVLQVKAYDIDISGQFIYKLEDRSGTFAIDPHSGLIRTISYLDFEVINIYHMVVTTDGPLPNDHKASANVTIVVQDINDNVPQFPRSRDSLILSEDTGMNTLIYTAIAFDRDSGKNAQLSYGIKGSPEIQDMITVDGKTGQVYLTKSLCSTNASTLEFWITATDHGILPLTAQLPITVNIQRDNSNISMVFEQSQYITSLQETAAVGTIVLTLKVEPSSRNQAGCLPTQHRFEITDSLSRDFFEIDDVTGEIKVKHSLVGLAIDQFHMDVAVQTQNGLKATTTVQISLLRNHYAPAFVNPMGHDVTIREDIPVGSIVDQVRAIDADKSLKSNIVTYEADGDALATAFFSVDPQHGLITVARNLSEGDPTIYYFHVKASDNGSPALSHVLVVTITVERNLHAPLFGRSDYEVSINENSTVGTTVIQLSASDRDTHAPYNTVHYMAKKDSDAMNYFQVDPVTGVVGLSKSLTLDADRTEAYQLIVEARDGGGYSTTARLLMKIIRNHAQQ